MKLHLKFSAANRLLTLAALAFVFFAAPLQVSAADLQVQKSCSLYPANGPQGVSCVVNVNNLSTSASGGPVTVTDTPTGPPGTQYLNASGTFGCTAPSGALPASIPCVYNGPIPGSGSGSTFFYFRLPPTGGTLNNCASAVQGGGVSDSNPANNNSCTSITVPGLSTGSITIKKVAQPNDPQDFKFTPNVATIPAFFLDDDSNSTLPNSRTFSNLPAGASMTFTESATPGWNLASVVCAPSAGTTTSVPNRTASIVLPAGANVTCTFTNVKVVATTPPDLSVVKNCTPGANHSTTCSITVTNNGTSPSLAPLTLVDALTNPPAGTLVTGASGNISCSGGGTYAPVNCTVTAPIPPTTSQTYLISFQFPTAGTWENCVQITQATTPGSGPESNLGNNKSCVKATIL